MGEGQHEAGREGRGTGGSVRWGTCRKRGHVGRGGAMQSQRISNPRDENKGGGNVNQWALRGRCGREGLRANAEGVACKGDWRDGGWRCGALEKPPCLFLVLVQWLVGTGSGEEGGKEGLGPLLSCLFGFCPIYALLTSG